MMASACPCRTSTATWRTVRVIMPSFGGATDKAAAKAFAAAWPGREIVPIDALDLVQGGGGIHGITLGQPAA